MPDHAVKNLNDDEDDFAAETVFDLTEQKYYNGNNPMDIVVTGNSIESNSVFSRKQGNLPSQFNKLFKNQIIFKFQMYIRFF